MRVPMFLGATTFFLASAMQGQVARVPSRPLPVISSSRILLLAELEATKVRVGEPIWIKFRLKNVSLRQARLVDTWPEHDFEITVADATGKEPPRTKFGDDSLHPQTLLRSIAVYLDPGQELQATMEITKVYQLAQVGVYSLRASRIVIRESKAEAEAAAEKAFSNTVTFTILP
jgi:hypothetical protein